MRRVLAGVALVALLFGSGLWLWWWAQPEVIVIDGGTAGPSAAKPGITFAPVEEDLGAAADAGVRRLEGRVVVGEAETPVPGARVEIYPGRPALGESARCNQCDQSAFECDHWSSAQALAQRARSDGWRPKPLAITTTDAQGRFFVEGVPAVLVTVIARSPSGTGTREWDFLPPEPAEEPDVAADGEPTPEPDPLVIAVEPPRPFELTVTAGTFDGSDPTPVPNARLLFWNLDVFEVQEVQADAAGRAHVLLPPGQTWLETEGPGVVAEGRSWSEDGNLVLTRARVLTVHVTAAGKPVDALVTVEGQHPESQTSTGGVARFTQLSGSEEAVRAEAQGMVARVSAPWTGQEGEATIALALRKSSRLLVSLIDETGNPVPDVTVQVSQNGFDAANGTSTEKGDLVILGPLPEGDAVLTIDTTEYRREERHLVLTPGDHPLEIVMRPLLKISGTVIDPDGQPANRAQVSTRSSTSGASADATDFTDDTGHFELGVEEGGSWTLDVTSPRGRAHVEVQAPAKDVKVQLDAMGTIDVTVVDELGRPIEEAYVTITEQAAMSVVPTTNRKDGHTTAAGLDPGRYLVSASADGFARTEQQVTVEDHRPATVRVSLARGVTIEGKVVDASGRPVGGVLLSVVEEPSGARSEEDGRFSLEGLRSGLAYEVTLELGDVGEVDAPRQKIKAPAKNVVFTLPNALKVHGHVVDRKGKPVTSFFANDTEIDAQDGAFEVSAYGRTLTINANGFVQKSVTLAGSNDVGEVMLESTPEVSGVVLDAAGQPVPGATVSRGPTAMDSSVTGADGSFRLSLGGPLDGPTHFTARRGTSTGMTAVSSLDERIVIRLHAPVRVHGAVFGSDGRPAASVLVQYSNDEDADQGRVESGADGHFELVLPQGRYTLSTRVLPAAQIFELQGAEQSIVLGQAGAACSVSIEANKFLELVALVPAEQPAVTPFTGASGSAAESLALIELPHGSMVVTPGQRSSTARLESVACGDYLLVVRAAGDATTRPVTLRPGSVQTVTIVFSEVPATPAPTVAVDPGHRPDYAPGP